MSAAAIEEEWKCRTCTLRLGVRIGHEMHIKYKASYYVVIGSVSTKCRRCKTDNHAPMLAPDLERGGEQVS